MGTSTEADDGIRDVRVGVAAAWALCAALLGVFVSIPAFLVIIAVTLIAAASVRIRREDGAFSIHFWLMKRPGQSALLLLQGAIFVALATAAFVHANTSLIAILLR